MVDLFLYLLLDDFISIILKVKLFLILIFLSNIGLCSLFSFYSKVSSWELPFWTTALMPYFFLPALSNFSGFASSDLCLKGSDFGRQKDFLLISYNPSILNFLLSIDRSAAYVSGFAKPFCALLILLQTLR